MNPEVNLGGSEEVLPIPEARAPSKLCSYPDKQGCTYYFKYIRGENNHLHVFAKRNKECGKSDDIIGYFNFVLFFYFLNKLQAGLRDCWASLRVYSSATWRFYQPSSTSVALCRCTFFSLKLNVTVICSIMLCVALNKYIGYICVFKFQIDSYLKKKNTKNP